jgi:hypothetical protein
MTIAIGVKRFCWSRNRLREIGASCPDDPPKAEVELPSAKSDSAAQFPTGNSGKAQSIGKIATVGCRQAA